jgi:phage shock protein A
MTKTHETQLALHEQRITAIEVSSSRVESKIDKLIDRIDNRFVTKLEYERDVKNQKEVNQTLIGEVEKIKECMVTQKQMKGYQRSQLWQKFLTALGTAVITAILVYEATKSIK